MHRSFQLSCPNNNREASDGAHLGLPFEVIICEPTLLPKLPKLIEYAKKLGMRVNLITNGTLIDGKMAKALAPEGLSF